MIYISSYSYITLMFLDYDPWVECWQLIWAINYRTRTSFKQTQDEQTPKTYRVFQSPFCSCFNLKHKVAHAYLYSWVQKESTHVYINKPLNTYGIIY